MAEWTLDTCVKSVQGLRKRAVKYDDGTYALAACDVLSYYFRVTVRCAVSRITRCLHLLEGAGVLVPRNPQHRCPRMVFTAQIPVFIHIMAHLTVPSMTQDVVHDISNAAVCHWRSRFAVLDHTPEFEGYIALRIDMAKFAGVVDWDAMQPDDIERVCFGAQPYCIFGCENLSLREVDTDDITFTEIETGEGYIFRFGFHKKIIRNFVDGFGSMNRSMMTAAGILRMVREFGLERRLLAWLQHVRAQGVPPKQGAESE
jgi:hypothetical protein